MKISLAQEPPTRGAGSKGDVSGDVSVGRRSRARLRDLGREPRGLEPRGLEPRGLPGADARLGRGERNGHDGGRGVVGAGWEGEVSAEKNVLFQHGVPDASTF